MSAAIEEWIEVSAPVPVRLWQENPHGPISLLRVLQIAAHRFIAVLEHLRTIESWCALGKFDADAIGPIMNAVEADCRYLGLDTSLKQVQRIHALLVSSLQSRRINLKELAGLLSELHARILDELEGRVFFQILPSHVLRFFVRTEPDGEAVFSPKDASDLFGPAVVKSFPSASWDIQESSRCFVTLRYTAGVFHLMRVLEIGLRALAEKFSLPTDHTNWNTMIEGIEKALRGMASAPDRSADWKNEQEFFMQAASHFAVLKDAWRNYTAHARGKYTEEEASLIFENTRAMMQKLSNRLSEVA